MHAAADSLVLERTRCFGTCPSYRLGLTATGRVTFTSDRETGVPYYATDSIAPHGFYQLVREAETSGFFTLPDTLAADRTLCPVRATDHATVIVTVFRGGRARAVVDDHGCFADRNRSLVAPVAELRRFEARVDSAAGSSRWVRPADRAR